MDDDASHFLRFLAQVAGVGLVGALAAAGTANQIATFQEPNNTQKIMRLTAESLANGTLEINVKAPKGPSINLNTLSLPDRTEAIRRATYLAFKDTSSQKAKARSKMKAEVRVTFYDPSVGYLCTLKVDPKFFDLALREEPLRAMSENQVIKSVEALGKECNLAPEKIAAMKSNVINSFKLPPEKPSTYGLAPDGRAVMPQRVVEPQLKLDRSLSGRGY